MDTFARKLNGIVEAILFVLLLAMTAIVFIQVLFRYFINAPLFWTEEAARYIMIWIVYLGASVGIRRGSHIGFTYFVEKVSPKVSKWFTMVATLGLLAFCLNFTYYGTIITLQNVNQLSSGLQIPIAAVYGVLPISGILCIIQLIPIIKKLLGHFWRKDFAQA